MKKLVIGAFAMLSLGAIGCGGSSACKDFCDKEKTCGIYTSDDQVTACKTACDNASSSSESSSCKDPDGFTSCYSGSSCDDIKSGAAATNCASHCS